MLGGVRPLEDPSIFDVESRFVRVLPQENFCSYRIELPFVLKLYGVDVTISTSKDLVRPVPWGCEGYGCAHVKGKSKVWY